MKIYYFEEHKMHDCKYHPENAGRIELIKDGLKIENISPKIYLDEIKRIHSEEYLERLKRICEKVEDYEFLDADNYITKHTYEVSLKAASLYFNIEDKDKAFLLTRPPGHHAQKNKYSGFCYLNNITIAASSENKIVLILDLDYHFGDGTYNLIKDFGNIYLISIHRFGVFPGWGHYLDSDERRVLIPIAYPLVSDREYYYIFEKFLLDFIDSIKPNRIFVSMGFDGYRGDPIGDWTLEKVWQKIFYDLRNYKLTFFLEGGYNPFGILEGIKRIERGLKGEDIQLTGNFREPFKREVDGIVNYLKKFI